jgi:hypothetical protein
VWFLAIGSFKNVVRRILELEMNTGERFQHVGVPRRAAIALVQVDDPAKYMNEYWRDVSV